MINAMANKTEFRHSPRQSRGRRRVDALLCAAAEELGKAGYDASTMSSIASRAGASIGSLYQFFPNKEAIVLALRRSYCDECEQMWAPLAVEAKDLSWKQLVDRLVDSTVRFVEQHPAFLALLDAPASTHLSIQARKRFERLVSRMLVARKPRMAREKAQLLATMVLQMVKTMNFLYRDLTPARRQPYVREFKTLLRRYLESSTEHRIK
jgi:AcrR family transcriptional regulator